MKKSPDSRRRRRLVKASGWGLLGLSVGPAGHAALSLTPPQTSGPFYPEELPLDSDNDLLRVSGRSGKANGITTNLVGRVLDRRGNPVAGAQVEIWQCDANGRYHHPDDPPRVPLDENFQGFGKTIADRDGRYRFRTIRPVPYPGRTPHIHFRVVSAERELITQLYVRGDPNNAEDGIFNGVADPETVVADFVPDPDQPGSLIARWDIVLATG